MKTLSCAVTKAINMVAIISICGFAISCTKNDVPAAGQLKPNIYINEPDTTTYVTISFSQFNMQPIGARTRAAVSDFATHLDLWLVVGTDTTAVHQSGGDSGFGSVSLTLDKTKTYTLYAIAHRCTGNAAFANNIISFPDNKVTASFYYTTTFSPATTTSLNCEMQRIVGQFRMEVTDALPDDVTQMKFTVYDTGTNFNTSTQTSGNPVDKETLYTTISKNNDGSANFTVTIMADDMTNTSHFTIKAEAMKANNDVVQERTFTDVPIKNGYKTTYRGTFFIDQGMSMSFTANDWTESDVINF